MNYTDVYSEATVLQSEISATIQQLLGCANDDELAELNVSAAQQLAQLQNKIHNLQKLNESSDLDENDFQQRKHNCEQIEASLKRLKEDLRKRIKQVEQQLGAGNRKSLLGEENQQRSKVTGAQATTRLRAVNNMVGQIINQGQV